MLILRLAAVLLLAACLQVSASAQSVSLLERDVTLDKVFRKIEQQTGYTFVYRDQLLQQAKKVTIDVKGLSLEKVLELCFKDQPLTYSIIDKTIVVGSKDARIAVTATASLSPITVTGQVLDEKGKPLAGVSITAEQSNMRASTNDKGEYSIIVDRKGTQLTFTYVGMMVEKLVVTKAGAMNVTLKEDQAQLEEMVVTGYGIKENKANQVGSAVRIGAKELQRKPVDRIDRLLEGLVPGLQYDQQDMNTSSARPRFQVRIRGEGSFAASRDPLWIIDGVPLYTGDETNMIPNAQTSISPLTYLNPDDIESISVLKDATATTIYGANGANGVIMITTKKGTIGRDRLAYSFRSGTNYIANKFEMLTADEYRMLLREAYENDGKAYPFEGKDQVSTNWYDVFFGRGRNSLHNLSLSGGSNKTRYFVSGSYYNEKPVMVANSTDRYTLRMNLDHELSKRLKLSFRLGGGYSKNKLFTPNNDYFSYRPINTPYNADGSFALYDNVTGTKFFNSLAEANQNDDNQSTINTNGNVGLTLKIIDGLTATSQNGIDFYNMRDDQYESFRNWSGKTSGGANVGYARRGQTSYLNWISINRLNFTRRFGAHAIDAVAGTEASADRTLTLWASGNGFATDYIREVTYAIDSTKRGGSGRTENSAFSMLGRLSYTYDNKYSVTANYRRDGNSRFGKDVRWANFVSVGGAWVISKEDFWHSKAIDFAKLKISYGTNGNSRIGSYAKGLYSFSDNYNYGSRPGAVMTTGANPRFSWETTYMLNTGIDLSFYKRVTVALEVYQNTTKDLIDQVDVTRTTGQTQIYQNIGSVRNKGIELSINSINIQNQHFQWETRFNMSKNRNKILELYNGITAVKDITFRQVGSDANTLYLVRWAGVDPADGRPMWLDAKGNVTYNFSTLDRVAVGSETPDFYGGMTNYFTYKGFTLSALITYSVGGHAFSTLRRNAEADGYLMADGNQSRDILNRWREPGDLALTPKLSTNSTSSSRNSTRFLHSKTNVRLTNISLNYEVPQRWVKKIGLSTANAYVQADNVGMWTPYESGNRNTFKNSFSSYPTTRTISFGVSVAL